MRESLTLLAIVLILALSALLVGPYLVDWNNQRDWLAAKLSQTMGARVKISGPIDIKLLPRPIFRFNAISMEGASRREPRFSATRLDAELSINSLLSGAVEFVDAEVAQPRIEVTARDDGSIVPISWDVSNPQKFMFKHVRVRDGTIAIKDDTGHEQYALTGITAQGEAESLIGPLKASGEAQGPIRPFKFRLNTGAYAGHKLRVKLVADNLAGLSRVDVDGTVAIGSTTGSSKGPAPLSFQGGVNLSGSLHVADGAAPVPWQATATDVKVDAAGATVNAVELRAGADARAFVANGSAAARFGDLPTSTVTLRARQLDLDHITVAPDIAPDTPRPSATAWVTALQALIADNDPSEALPSRMTLTFDVDAVTTGDLTLTDASGTIEAARGLPLKGRIGINGPAGTRVAFDGTLETGTAAVFRGRVDAGTRDLPTVADWLAPAFPDASAWVKRTLPFHAVEAKGGLDLAKTGFAARDMSLSLDGSSFEGSIALTGAVANERPRLFADVSADVLDAEHLPELSALAPALEPLDLSIGVSAKAAKLSRTGASVVETGRLALHVTKTKEAVSLDEFSVAGLGGATVTATASMTADKLLQAQGRVAAVDFAPLAAILRQAAPNAVTEGLATRAGLFSPLSLDFKAEGTLDADYAATPTLATAVGTLGATRLSATITPEPARVFRKPSMNTLVVLDAPDAGVLLQQWGLDDAPRKVLGAGHAEITARGMPDSGFETQIAANLAESTLAFTGHVDGAIGSGQMKAGGGNAAPLLKAFGLPIPTAAAVWPWSAESDLDWDRERLTAGTLSGRFNGAGVKGSLAFAYGPPPPNGAAITAVSGRLTLDALPLAALTGFVLGAPANQPPRAGRAWSETRFGSAPANMPRTEIDMNVRALGLTDTVVARNAAFDLKIAPGSVTLSDLSAEVLGGNAGGSFTLRRDGGTVSLAGQARWSDIPLALPSLGGRLTGTLGLAGSGTSPDALVGSFAGDGSLSLADAKIPHVDPRALADVAKAYDTEVVTLDDGTIKDSLAKALDRAPLDLGTITTPASLAAGTLRVTGVTGQGPAFAAKSEAAFDLRSIALMLRTNLTAAELPKDWKGEPPQVTVTARGPLSMPVREVDAAAFANGLAARAIARDQERIQLMQDDLRERGFFARRLKAIEAEQQAARDAAQAAKALLQNPKTPDIRPPARPGDGAARGGPALQGGTPSPPVKPLGRPPSSPVQLQSPPQPPDPAGTLNMPDPTAAGRY